MTEYGKLVRDRIPDLIRSRGAHPVVEVLAPADVRPALLAKLAEECAEAAEADEGLLVEELADVAEVLRALAHGLGLSMDDVLRVADAKAEQRGGFEQGLYLVRIDEPGASAAGR